MPYCTIQWKNDPKIRDMRSQEYMIGCVKGNSMLPALKAERDIAIIESVEGTTMNLRKGEIVLYKERGKLILHRIIKVSYPTFVVAGDHNLMTETIKADQILGKLKTVIRDDEKIDWSEEHRKVYVFLWGRRPGLRRVTAFLFRIMEKVGCRMK